MKIGIVGLGKMGYNLSLNLIDHRYEEVATDVKPRTSKAFPRMALPGFHLFQHWSNSFPVHELFG
ncbi:NAD(P)-binding domain-containing protein [Bacillus sp. V3-13]|uniref:NAD(P)-binding domain-containing protein n=1 Tax=Bacillus sp. V3-13 TaxID=2053728 RepID=UPI0021537F4B|nr:NAD(P)-binding domain-containing protein [Bacillus sp. V3-13]